MSYEDLEKAPEKEAANETKKAKQAGEATAGKGKRGRNGKSSKQTDVPESETKMAQINQPQIEERVIESEP